MKSTPPIRIIAAAAATAFLTAAVAQGAPKKPQPAPATQQSAEPKAGFFSKVKNMLPFTKKQPAPAAVPPKAAATATPNAKQKPQPAPAQLTAAKKLEPAPAKSKVIAKQKDAAKQKAVAKTEAAPAEPKKPGMFRKLFTWKRAGKTEAAGPNLANAKTAKPAPAPAKEKKVELAAAEEPKPKRSFFGFFKKLNAPLEENEIASTVPDDLKIERPKDWAEYSIIREDEVALYEDGPAQLGGANARLTPGTLVKVTKKEKGWAVVEIQGENKRTGYIDELALRSAEKGDFNDPPPPPPVQMAAATPSFTLDPWAPLAPPPDLPEQPGATDAADALLLLPPLELELEPKP